MITLALLTHLKLSPKLGIILSFKFLFSQRQNFQAQKNIVFTKESQGVNYFEKAGKTKGNQAKKGEMPIMRLY